MFGQCGALGFNRPRRGSWLNLAVWFGIIERQAIHRGTLGNVRQLTSK
jgi:hypothetical protein